MRRMGQKSFLTIFFILAAALTITGWFQAQTTSGSQTQDILEQSTLAESQGQESNVQNFIKQSLSISAAQSSGETAEMSGREEEGEQYRYWLCDGEAQTPNREQVRQMTADSTQDKMGEWLEKARGEQDKWIHAVGQQQCSEIGYRTPMDDPKNDNWLAGITIDGLTVSHKDGEVVRNQEEPDISSRVRFNRLWYTFQNTKQWVQDDLGTHMKDSVRAELEELPDVAQKVDRGCGGVDCPQLGDIWQSDHPTQIKEAVHKGIRDELDRLEENEEYFNGNDVKCTYEFKETSEGEQYPTWNVYHTTNEEFPECEKDEVGGCGNCLCPEDEDASYDGDSATTRRVSGHDTQEDPPGGGGGGGAGVCPCGEWSDNEIEGTSNNAMYWDVWVDAKVECTDTKFNSLPQEDDLEPLTWRFDVSFMVEERSIDNPFVCEGPGETVACTHAYDKEPFDVRNCELPEDDPAPEQVQQQMCESGVNTIEATR